MHAVFSTRLTFEKLGLDLNVATIEVSLSYHYIFQ